MSSRKKKPDRRGPPPVIYPKLPCVGGPRDGEVVSQLDLPWEGGMIRRGFDLRWTQGNYVRGEWKGVDSWIWQEVSD